MLDQQSTVTPHITNCVLQVYFNYTRFFSNKQFPSFFCPFSYFPLISSVDIFTHPHTRTRCPIPYLMTMYAPATLLYSPQHCQWLLLIGVFVCVVSSTLPTMYVLYSIWFVLCCYRLIFSVLQSLLSLYCIISNLMRIWQKR